MRSRRPQFLPVAVAIMAAGPSMRAAEPNDYEQYALELINRARANPTQEVTRTAALTASPPSLFTTLFKPWERAPSLNEGPPSIVGIPYVISSSPKQPLAFNPTLVTVARSYAATCRQKGQINHYWNGTTPDERMGAAGYLTGYAFDDAVVENDGTYWAPGEEMLFTMNTTGGSWTSAPGVATRKRTAADVSQHALFVDAGVAGRGHRLTMMASSFREIGIGLDFGSETSSTSSLFACYDLGFIERGQPFITGVAYRDLDGDGFYTPGTGEALGGVTVQIFAAGGAGPLKTTTTYASGGYAVQVPPHATYDVRFSGAQPVTFPGVVVGAANVKIDWVPGATLTAAEPFAVRSVVPEGADVVVSWASVPGLTYRVQTSADLLTWTAVATSQTTATSATASWRHTAVLATAGQIYYRVERL